MRKPLHPTAPGPCGLPSLVFCKVIVQLGRRDPSSTFLYIVSWESDFDSGLLDWLSWPVIKKTIMLLRNQELHK